MAGESPYGYVNLSIIRNERFSSFQKLPRTTAWILRYVDKFKKRKIVTGLLTPQELKKAMLLLWDQHMQHKCYSDLIEMRKLGKNIGFHMEDQK